MRGSSSRRRPLPDPFRLSSRVGVEALRVYPGRSARFHRPSLVAARSRSRVRGSTSTAPSGRTMASRRARPRHPRLVSPSTRFRSPSSPRSRRDSRNRRDSKNRRDSRRCPPGPASASPAPSSSRPVGSTAACASRRPRPGRRRRAAPVRSSSPRETPAGRTRRRPSREASASRCRAPSPRARRPPRCPTSPGTGRRGP